MVVMIFCILSIISMVIAITAATMGLVTTEIKTAIHSFHIVVWCLRCALALALAMFFAGIFT